VSALGNPKHERFCQELHKLVWAGGSTKESRITAYQAAGFMALGESLNDNARRFANLKHIKARLAELSDYAAKLAGIDAGWAMLRLKQLAESNLDDYLGPADEDHNRYFTIGKTSREKLDCCLNYRWTRKQLTAPKVQLAVFARQGSNCMTACRPSR